jgi:hypothetical protein
MAARKSNTSHKNLSARLSRRRNPELVRAARKRYYAKHSEQIKEAQRRFYARTRERQRAYAKRYYLNHRSECRANMKAQYRKNRTKWLAQVREHRRKNREHFLAYDRRRRRENPARIDTRILRWRKANPLAAKAHAAVLRSVKRGEIVRPNHCTDCNEKRKLHAHHHRGYERPLDVEWLCASCHRLRHSSQKTRS